MKTSFTDNTPVTGARSADDHYLQLDANETALIQEVCSQNFKHVIIIINSNSAMELGFLEDESYYAYNSKIDAALWIGSPGKSGIMALGNILNGSVNPSGHLVDTYVTNLKDDPTWNNFGNNLVSTNTNLLSYSSDKDYDKGNTYIVDGVEKKYYYTDYEEGIYVGYRYYETRGFTDGEDWYQSSVVYPFGYGLSYTTFSAQIINKQDVNGTKLTKDGKIKITVRVTNDGDVAGKEVVQLYATTPYKTGEIEKAYKVLCAFEKTGIIQPGEYEDVTLEVDPYDLASYDYNDANNNNFCGYELDAGKYTFTLGSDAHTDLDSVELVLDSGIKYETDPTTDTEVVNEFDDAADELGTVLSRTDWQGTWPQSRTIEERTVSKSYISSLSDYTTNRDVSTIDTSHNSYTGETDYGFVSLKDLVGAEYDDERWDVLLDEIGFDKLLELCNFGGFKTIDLSDYGKAQTYDTDGPVGWTNFQDPDGIYDGTCSYASECLLGATWNKEIMYKMGESVGNEALIGYSGVPYTTWYAPAVNIHRSAFGGRNFEYFSEDSYLAGMMASYEIQGAMSKGVNPTIKHFALNEQETNRQGVLTWATEQSIREIYLKPFERAVKQAGVRGVMSSFNRIGKTWTGGNYNLITTVLRDEWGFNGVVISDFNTCIYMDPEQMAYAGGNLNLAKQMDYMWLDADKNNPYDVAVVRENAHGVLYALANSNALNVEVIGYTTPWWITLLIVVDCVVVAGCAVWGFFAIKKALKQEKEAKNPKQ
jgi:beta-glucosidase